MVRAFEIIYVAYLMEVLLKYVEKAGNYENN